MVFEICAVHGSRTSLQAHWDCYGMSCLLMSSMHSPSILTYKPPAL